MRAHPGLLWLEGLRGAWAVSHALSVLVFGLTLALVARVIGERRPPASTISWLLAIGLIPYVGVPLFLLLDGRKRRLVRGSSPRPGLRASLDGDAPAGAPDHRPPSSAVTMTTRATSVLACAIERVLDTVPMAQPTCGNACRLLASGPAARDAILGAIDGARASVHVTTFIVGADDVGEALLERLARAAARGVEVRLLLDGVFAWRARRASVRRARAAGARIEVFTPLLRAAPGGRANLRNHRKLVVVDGELGYVGGMNFASEYMGGAAPGPAHIDVEPRGATQRGGCWRDLMLEVRGPAVARIDEAFRSDWAFAVREELGPPPTRMASAEAARFPDAGARGRVQVVPSGPDVPGDTLYDVVLTALYRAERRAWIATPYFIPDEALVRGLELAVRRGVDVTIVVPARSNHVTADLAGAGALRLLDEAGARVRPWVRGMLHAKAAVFDDVALVGSANFDMRSLFLSYELSLLLTSQEDVGSIAAWFEETLGACAPRLTPPGRLRAACEALGRLLAPLV